MRDCARGLSVVRLIKDIASSKIDKKKKLHFYIQIFNKRMHRSPIHIVLINVQIRRRTYKICTIYSPKRGELLRMHPGHPHPTSFFALPLSFRTLKPVFFLSLSLFLNNCLEERSIEIRSWPNLLLFRLIFIQQVKRNASTKVFTLVE